jgi:phosphoglycolate phosphatase-like HAD superfamily hydrolase
MALEVVVGSSRLGSFNVFLTDFERTLARLFEDPSDEQRFFSEIWKLCKNRGVPDSVREAAGESPYCLWTNAHQWMAKHVDPIGGVGTYHAVSKIAREYEMEAAPNVKLFKDVQPVLERLKAANTPVLIVSNNATEAVERVLKENNVEGLVDHVIGRQYNLRMGRLKPKPYLVLEALKLSGRGAGTALFVGDSVDDMRAGRAAGIERRIGLLDHSTASRWQLRRAGARLVLNTFGDLEHLVPGGDRSGVG